MSSGPMAADSGAVFYRFHEDQATFLHGSVDLHVRPQYADRSKLPCDMRDQTDSNVDFPLAVSVHELQAWQACIQATEEQTSTEPTTLSDLSHDTIISALNVSTSQLRQPFRSLNFRGQRCVSISMAAIK